MLIDGEWRDEDPAAETGKGGVFARVDSAFRDRITADGSSGFKAEAGRYHLYVALRLPVGAPHADLPGAEEARGLDHGRLRRSRALREQGWTFGERPALSRLHARHRQRLPLPARGVYGDRSALHRQGDGADPVGQEDQTDRQQRIVRDHPHAQQRVRRDRRQPHRLLSGGAARGDRPDERAASTRTSTTACIAPASPSRRTAYDAAYDGAVRDARRAGGAAGAASAIWSASQITEADWRLFPTLVRFDVAYFSIFKCNRQRIADYPNLSNYMRELYSRARRRRDREAALLRASAIIRSAASTRPASSRRARRSISTPPHDRARLAA